MLRQAATLSACIKHTPQLNLLLNSSYAFSTTKLQILVEPLSDQNEGISILSLNRAEARNALGRQLIRELGEAIDNLRQESTTRCVIIKSAVPGVFCAGADLKERATMTQHEAAEFVSMLRLTFAGVEELPMPTIAVVEGAAMGGGAELALAADLRVAGPGAAFAFPETRLGIIPGAGGTQRLPRLIGLSRAKNLIFTGRRVGAHEALALGLVDELGAAAHATKPGEEPGADPGGSVEPKCATAYERALQMAREVAKGAPLALRQAKAAISVGMEVDQKTGMRIEGACYAQLLHTADRLEGLRAFAEKRPPAYTGQ